MIISSPFKKTIFVSLLGHLTVFSIFSFTFGNNEPAANYAPVFFLGQFLRNTQVAPPVPREGQITLALHPEPSLSPVLHRAAKDTDLLTKCYLKPSITLTPVREKKVFTPETHPSLFIRKSREPTIVFHPMLPYGFTLYFKDRQVVHVELMYKLDSFRSGNPILIKRKISSGNLEVDLLTMRYIEHYLFIQQKSITTDNWQTVKIDLSAKEE